MNVNTGQIRHDNGVETMAHQCIHPKCSATCTDCNEARPMPPMGSTVSRHNLDDLRRLRDEAMAAGPGSGRWIKAAQALMDAFPDYYATAKAMNAERATLRAAMAVVVRDWTEQFERNGHLAPSWVKQARAALGQSAIDPPAGCGN